MDEVVNIVPHLDNSLFYLIVLIIYIIGMMISFKYDLKFVVFVMGLLWFIPITTIDNLYLNVVSVVMILIHGYIGLYTKKGDDFE
ncbi:MAG: hypothetical protein QXN68_02660 [Thermoplasmata archaeon]